MVLVGHEAYLGMLICKLIEKNVISDRSTYYKSNNIVCQYNHLRREVDRKFGSISLSLTMIARGNIRRKRLWRLANNVIFGSVPSISYP